MITVYTAIIGNKDTVLHPIPYPDTKYVLFSDNTKDFEKYYEMGWEPKYLPTGWSDDKRYSSRRSAKIVKIMPHLFLDTEFSLWMDGTHMPKIPPMNLVDSYLRYEHVVMATFEHPVRNCIYDEGNHILQHCGFLDDPSLIKSQLKYYEQKKFPKSYGLSATTVILRRHSPTNELISYAWWEQINKFSSRDQLSLYYCHWKLNTKENHTFMPGHWCKNNLVPKVKDHLDARK